MEDLDLLFKGGDFPHLLVYDPPNVPARRQHEGQQHGHHSHHQQCKDEHQIAQVEFFYSCAPINISNNFQVLFAAAPHSVLHRDLVLEQWLAGEGD